MEKLSCPVRSKTSATPTTLHSYASIWLKVDPPPVTPSVILSVCPSVGWLVGQSVCWSSDRRVTKQKPCLSELLVGWLGRSVSLLVFRQVTKQKPCLSELLVGWLGRSVGLLSCWSSDRRVTKQNPCLSELLVGCLVGW